MSDDPIATLERELVDAARRRTAAVSSADELSVRRARRGHGLGGMIAAAASILVVLLIAGGALLVLHRGGRTAGSGQSPVSVWAKRLAVLRRPQTRADRIAIYRDGNTLPAGVVQPSSIRLARRTPWGASVLLGVIVRGTGHGQLAVGAGAAFGVQHFDHDRILAYEGQGGHSVTQLVLVVADGIARVQIHGRGHPASARPVGNVVAVSIRGGCCISAVSVTAYRDDGTVVARFKAPVIPTRSTPEAR